MAGSKQKESVEDSLKAKLAEALGKPLPRHEDTFYKPRPQGYFFHDGAEWVDSRHSARRWSSSASPSSTISTTTKVQLISWNIDILTPFGPERMSAALKYLEKLISSSAPDIPVVVFLQEMSPSDLQLIRDTAWVQRRFLLTELDATNWLSGMYGTQMLVDRRLKVEGVFRVPWVSRFERDGLFVDLCLRNDGGEEGASAHKVEDNNAVLRLCNTHLESLVAKPPVRPLQLSAAAKYLQEEDVKVALLAGDLNAIEPFDRTSHTDNGLEDAYLIFGGKEDSDEGYTWGIQVPQWLKDQFGPSRMDKILYRGEVKPQAFERVGIDVKVDESVREEVKEKGAEEWVTDHYGVMGILNVTDGFALVLDRDVSGPPGKGNL